MGLKPLPGGQDCQVAEEYQPVFKDGPGTPGSSFFVCRLAIVWEMLGRKWECAPRPLLSNRNASSRLSWR
jgi:hypothetical protein